MPDTSMQSLLTRLLNGTITIAEKEELSRQMQQTNDEALSEQISALWQEGRLGELLTPAQPALLLATIMEQARTAPAQPATNLSQQQEAPIVRLQTSWKRTLIAAASIALLAIAGYWLLNRSTKNNTPPPIVQIPTPDIPAPQINRARITLASGEEILLDSANTGQLAQQGNMQVIKQANGQLLYKTAGNSATTTIYNTLTNPRGSQVIDMTLSDGSRIWLNANSSLTYPVAFTGNERSVTVNGEAYFEIAKNPSKPFIVSKGTTQIQVLGTHFNVNAYDDEKNELITLLEGKVEVKRKDPAIRSRQSAILRPGQQAVFTADSRLTIADNADLDGVMAWRNGRFLFEEGTDIEVIMRQIARWYDVEVQYKGTINKHIGGSISRNASLAKTLAMLEATGTVHFAIQGKLIIVQP